MNRSRLAAIAVVGAGLLAVSVASGAATEPPGPPNGPPASDPVTTAIGGPPTDDHPIDGGDPNAVSIGQQNYSTVFEPEPGKMASTPFADAFDTKDADGNPTRSILLSWQENADLAAANSVRTQEMSYDGGYTFPSGFTPGNGMAGFYHRLKDGTIYGVEFVPKKLLNPHQVLLTIRRSTNNGRTWRQGTTTLTTDKTFDQTKFDRGIRVHRDILDGPHNTLLMTYYTGYKEDSSGSSEIAISHDEGHSWHRLATVFPSDGTRSFNEEGISWAANGDLVALGRSHVSGVMDQLYTARSSDAGRTWTTPVPAAITTVDGTPVPVPSGVMPVMKLLPNGVMTLTFGRPDNWFAVSPDGLGRSFTQAQETYRNFPDQDAGTFQRFHGSGGNGAHVVVDSNRVLQVGDNCIVTWGCPATDSGFTIDRKFRIWKKFIDVDGPGVGRIDLLSKYEHGAVKISTDMTARDHALPALRPVGAIDGSTDWGSSAVGAKRVGHYTLTLDHTYTLTKAGLSLHPGLPSSATVQVSTDGKNWTTAFTTGTVTSYAMSYRPIANLAAKYVRVTVDDPNREAVGRAFLNEVELYSTTDSFENDAVGYVPRGYTNAVGATVTDEDTDGDKHALRLADAWNDKQAQATWKSAAAPTQDLSFRFQSMGYPRTLQFITNGTTASGATIAAYQVAMLNDGHLAYYDATAKTWNHVGTSVIPQHEWHAVSVRAGLSGAEVFLDGTSVGKIPPTTAGATALTGHTFASTGTSSTYDNFVIDDVTQS